MAGDRLPETLGHNHGAIRIDVQRARADDEIYRYPELAPEYSPERSTGYWNCAKRAVRNASHRATICRPMGLRGLCAPGATIGSGL